MILCDTSQNPTVNPVDRFEFSEDYLARLRKDDDETWEHFYKFFRWRIRTKFRAQFRWEIAEDLTSETIAAAVDKIRQGEPEHGASLRGYVLSICRNKALEMIRKLTNEKALSDVDCDSLAANSKTPQQECLSKQDSEKVKRTLQGLSERDRTVLLRAFYFGQDRDEICRQMGITRKKLKMILFHARHRFQRQWNRD